MTVGELRRVGMPARGGRAQAGRRPAVIFQQTATLPTVLLIPLTSQQDALRFAATVLAEPDEQNGLRRPSVALVFQLTAVDKNFVGDRIGRISDATLKEVWSAFDELTGRG